MGCRPPPPLDLGRFAVPQVAEQDLLLEILAAADEKRSKSESGRLSPIGSPVTEQSTPRHSRRFFMQSTFPGRRKVQHVGYRWQILVPWPYSQNSLPPQSFESSCRSGSIAV
jgi:hypothetical protein